MSEIIGIVGPSGSGKSTSVMGSQSLNIKGLDLKKAYYINIMGKPLPGKGWKKNFNPCKIDISNPSAPKIIPVKPNAPGPYNYIETRNPLEILSYLGYIAELLKQNPKQFKYGIIDDYQYIMANEFMEKALTKGYDKFSSIAMNGYNVLMSANDLPGRVNTYILMHTETTDTKDGETVRKIKTIGKMLDEKVTLEGIFRILLFVDQNFDEEGNIRKFFVTNATRKYSLAKSPPDMFESKEIPNDLGYVDEKIREYDV